jgi:hypothetical protein
MRVAEQEQQLTSLRGVRRHATSWVVGRRSQTAAARLAAIAVGALVQAGCVTSGTTEAAHRSVTEGTAASLDARQLDGLAKCTEPLGALAIDDGRQQAWWQSFSNSTQISTIEPLLRLVVQQSNCFTITSVGLSRLDGRMAQVQRSGEVRAGSNSQRGRRVAADYYLEPEIRVAEGNPGGIGGALGGFGAGWGGLAAGVAGAALRQQSTTVTMSLFDVRSGMQAAASQGTSTGYDSSSAFAGLGSGAGGTLGAYQRTPQGRAAVTAFIEAYNKLVVAARNRQAENLRGGMSTGGRLRMNGPYPGGQDGPRTGAGTGAGPQVAPAGLPGVPILPISPPSPGPERDPSLSM